MGLDDNRLAFYRTTAERRCALPRRVGVCALILLLASCSSMKTSVDSARPTIRTVVLAGTPSQMGQTHGRELRKQILPLHEAYIRKWIRNETQRTLAMGLAARFEQYLRPEHREEIFAMADASGMDRRQAMLGNCFLDVGSMVACSTMTLAGPASSDGVPRFARNLDFPSFNLADSQSVLFVYKPDTGHNFVAVGWPGLAGVLSGMNEHGLTLANMEVTRTSRAPAAMPYALLYRTVLERCRTVDEAIVLLRDTPRQTANNLMLMDAAGRRALVEIYPAGIAVRQPAGNEALISTNHRRVSLDGAPFVPPPCSRYSALAAASAKLHGQWDVEKLQAALAEVAQGDMTLQSMIFEPTNRVMYLATGKNAATRTWERLDLQSLLAADSPRPSIPQAAAAH